MKINAHELKLITLALEEDIGVGDITAELLNDSSASARLICKEDAILCGTAWFTAVYNQLDKQININWLAADGDQLVVGQTVCVVTGPVKAILTGERTALNFLQTLSGTATQTNRMVKMLAGSACQLLDTRKTIPGFRGAQKYAVRCGGGQNHRQGLYDAFLIKENHIRACGGITQAIHKALKVRSNQKIEIEVENLTELNEALDAGAEMILLDNFSSHDISQAIKINNQRAKLEVSGNVDENTINQLAELGVDFISSGALTKHVRAIDFSLLVDEMSHNKQ